MADRLLLWQYQRSSLEKSLCSSCKRWTLLGWLMPRKWQSASTFDLLLSSATTANSFAVCVVLPVRSTALFTVPCAHSDSSLSFVRSGTFCGEERAELERWPGRKGSWGYGTRTKSRSQTNPRRTKAMLAVSVKSIQVLSWAVHIGLSLSNARAWFSRDSPCDGSGSLYRTRQGSSNRTGTCSESTPWRDSQIHEWCSLCTAGKVLQILAYTGCWRGSIFENRTVSRSSLTALAPLHRAVLSWTIWIRRRGTKIYLHRRIHGTHPQISHPWRSWKLSSQGKR